MNAATMNAAVWERVGEAFAEAVELPAVARPGFLDRLDDDGVRGEVERLLAADADADSFLEEPVCRLESPRQTEEQNMRVGAYRLQRPLGEGGMGTVYLARRDDDQFERRVAVKMVRRDLLDPGLLDRFERERRTLARLEHPLIARLYDSGTTPDGRPFLVMERVDGEPLTDHCTRQGLDLEARLGLFRQVCEAVAYAHRQRIVHRDLKPSNVLVDAEGRVRLIDFGISVILETTAPSGGIGGGDTSARRLTPGYASPEQIRGETVTAASDVYSLGVLLYELLAERSPYSGPSHDLTRAVCEKRIEQPSQAPGPASRERRRRLRGDLDAIVLRALSKEPSKRYASVEALAQDVERHLADRPVRARPATLTYRVTKLVRRRRTALVAALAMAMAMAMAMTMSFGLATLGQARQQQREQQEHSVVAAELTQLLVTPPPTSAPPSDNLLATDDLLALAAPRAAAELFERPLARAALLDSLGRVHHEAGRSATAEQLITESVAVYRQQRTADDPPAREEVTAVHDLGAVRVARGDVARGEPLLRAALAERRRQAGGDDVMVAESREALGLSRWHAGDTAAAEAELKTAVEIRENVFQGRSYWSAAGWSALAALYVETGRFDEASSAIEAARERRQAWGEHRPDRARTFEDEGHLALARGEHGRAVEAYRHAVALRRSLLPDDGEGGVAVEAEATEQFASQRELAASVHYLARALGESGAWEEARQRFSESLALLRATVDETSPEGWTILGNLAVVLGNAGEHGTAEHLLRQVLAWRTANLGEMHPHVVQTRYNLGVLLHDLGRLDEAADHYRAASASLDGILAADHPARAYPRVAWGRWLIDTGEPEAAEAELRGALVLLREAHPKGHWRIADAEALLGASLADQGRRDEAAAMLASAVDTLRAARGARDPRSRRAQARLAQSRGS